MNLIILGTGAFAREAINWCEQSIDIETGENHKVCGFYTPIKDGITNIYGIPVYNNIECIPKNLRWVVGSGDPKIINENYTSISHILTSAKPIIHPSVICGKNIEIGDGTLICPGVILTCDIKIGKSVLINIGCTIGHDSIIGDFVNISPNSSLSGYTKIGDFCNIGTGTITVPYVSIINKSITGAGTVVTKNLEVSGTYVGAPAKLLLNSLEAIK